MTRTITNKVKTLQESITDLDIEVADINNATTYLNLLIQEINQEFAYTNRQPDMPKFVCTVVINKSEIDIPIPADTLLSELEKDSRIEDLKMLKVKLAQIEKLLEE